MADQLITQELLQSLNARLNESIRKQAETVNLMAGRDPNFRGLVNDLEALCDAPMSKALEKADVWRTRLRQAISEYKVPEMTRDDANQIFDVELRLSSLTMFQADFFFNIFKVLVPWWWLT